MSLTPEQIAEKLLAAAKRLFWSRTTVTQTVQSRPMTAEEQAAFDRAFAKFDEAFVEFDKVFSAKEPT